MGPFPLAEFRGHLGDRLGKRVRILWEHVDAVALEPVPFPLAALGDPQVGLVLPGSLDVQEVGPAAALDLLALFVVVHTLLHPLPLYTSSDIQWVFVLAQSPEPGKELLGLSQEIVDGDEWFAVRATPRP